LVDFICDNSVSKSEKSENRSDNRLEPPRTRSETSISFILILVLGELKVVICRKPLNLAKIFPVNLIPCISFFLILNKLLIL
jgi:hypothetical protein